MSDSYYEDDHVVIYHGDCKELLPDLVFDVVVTDPPYGTQGTHSPSGYGRKQITIQGDTTQELSEHIVNYCELKNLPLLMFADPLQPVLGKPKRQLIWDKKMMGLGGSLVWRPSHEVIWVYGEGWQGKQKPTVISRHRLLKNNHPHQKSLSLMVELLQHTPNGIIVDPFMGSGTTLRAAKDLGRKAIGIEIDEKYCEIAAKRMGQEVLPI